LDDTTLVRQEGCSTRGETTRAVLEVAWIVVRSRLLGVSDIVKSRWPWSEEDGGVGPCGGRGVRGSHATERYARKCMVK
jgi:hypothetical protein